MAKFDMNSPFVLDDWKDPVDLVIMTDEEVAAAEEKSEENADKDPSGDGDVSAIDALKECGCVDYDCDDEDEEDLEYDEDQEDDEDADFVNSDAEEYRESRDGITDAEDMEEDDEIDAVIGDEEDDGEDELEDDNLV